MKPTFFPAKIDVKMPSFLPGYQHYAIRAGGGSSDGGFDDGHGSSGA